MVRKQRLIFWVILFLIPFFVIEGRVYYLQVIEGSFFRGRLADQSTLLELTFPMRGRILDSSGRILTDNVYRYALEAPLRFFLKASAGTRQKPASIARLAFKKAAKETPEPTWQGPSFIQAVAETYGIDAQALQQTVDRAKSDWFRRWIVDRAGGKGKKGSFAGHTGSLLLEQGLDQSLLLADHLDASVLYRYERAKRVYPLVHLQTHIGRVYPYGPVAAHVLGYTGFLSSMEKQALLEREHRDLRRLNVDVPEEVLSDLDQTGHLDEQFYGRLGVEAEYNAKLAGRPGVLEKPVFPESTSSIFKESTFQNQPRFYPVLVSETPGQDVSLTLDIEFEKAVQEEMEQLTEERHLKGSFIMMDASTGDIMAMVSVPGFDPNRLVPYSPDRNLSALSAPEKPLLNRAVSGVYPPGSIFKVVGALEGLESHRITPQTLFTCPGYYVAPGRTFHCWNLLGHGALNVWQGLEHSCNVFFFSLGKRLSNADLLSMVRRLRIGQATGIDLPSESAGFLPAHPKESSLDFFNRVIGQGDISLTPLQLTVLMATVANRGGWVRPRVSSVFSSIARLEVGLDPSVWDPVWHGLWAVVHGPGGTAHHSGLSPLAVFGKTSTAQVGGGGTHPETHASFCGFFPKGALTLKEARGSSSTYSFEEEENTSSEEEWKEIMRTHKEWISFCLHLERGGSGPKVAAEFSRDLLEVYRRFYTQAK